MKLENSAKKSFSYVRHAALIAVFAASPAFAQNLAVVNGTPIPAARADAVVKELVQQGQKDSPQLQKTVRDGLIEREVLWQEATKEGIAQRPEVKQQLAEVQESLVLRAMLADYASRHPISDADVKAAYTQFVKENAGRQEYHLQHILVDNEAQAKDLIAKLKAGADFDTLAKQFSKDAGSAARGGDLNWADPKVAFVPEFSAGVLALKKGQTSDTPVHTKFGWHIIRVDDIRPMTPPKFDDVKEPLRKQLEQKQLQAWTESLRAQAKIQ